MRPSTSLNILASALALAALAGCAAPGVTSAPAATGDRLTPLSGDAAVELAGIKVRIIDMTRADRTVQALPTGGFSAWTNCVVRLSNGTALTDDRTAVIDKTTGGWVNAGSSYVYGGGAGNTLFTKLRPTTGYKLSVSLLDGSDRALTTGSVSFDLAGGTMTRLLVVMSKTDDGKGLSLAVASTGTESYTGGASSVSLKNSVAALAGANAPIPLVLSDSARLTAGLADTATVKAQTAAQGGSGGTTGISSVANLDSSAVLGRVTASVINGVCPAGTVANGAELAIAASNNITAGQVKAVPDMTTETVLANWFRAGNEPESGLPYYDPSQTAAFFGATNPGTLAGLNSTAFPATTVYTSPIVNNVGFGGTADWTVVAPPGLTAGTTEVGATGNATLIFRYYAATYDHHLIAAKKASVLQIENGANIGLEVN